jgi:DNA-binding LacI/PurR family transcriptional regulator
VGGRLRGMATTRTTRRVTLRDVAGASGVSPSTVSFVLNDVRNQTISPATRERVQTAARDLGYVPNGIARALMEGSSRIVVLNIERNREGNYSRNFIRGLDEELALHGFALLVRHGHPSDSDAEQITNVIAPRAVLQFGEVYLTGHELEDSGGGWKNGMAAHVLLQFRYLSERGHTAIALALPEDEPLAGIRERFAREVVEMLELAPIEVLTVPRANAEVGAALTELRSQHPAITAIAGFSDFTALQVLAAMRKLGLTAPGDLAVIGFDESEYAEMFCPTLTTLTADAEGHGRHAARQALGLDTSDVKTKIGRVIARESA